MKFRHRGVLPFLKHLLCVLGAIQTLFHLILTILPIPAFASLTTSIWYSSPQTFTSLGFPNPPDLVFPPTQLATPVLDSSFSSFWPQNGGVTQGTGLFPSLSTSPHMDVFWSQGFLFYPYCLLPNFTPLVPMSLFPTFN